MIEPNELTSEETTDEQKHELGLAALHLVQDPTFRLVMSTLGGEAIDILVRTEPKDRPKREDCYFLYVALQSINDTLQSWISQAAQIEQENNPEEGQ